MRRCQDWECEPPSGLLRGVMNMRRLSTVLAAVVMGVFSGAGVATAASPSPTRGTITVTFHDEGHSYTMHRGEHLDVRLHGPGISSWTEPSSSSTAVLKQLSGTSGETATAVFVAASSGSASVTAIGTPGCAPECPLLVLFDVKITVKG